MKFQILSLSSLMIAVPALAQPQDQGQPASPAASARTAPDAERKICRTIQLDTGTRIGGRKKLCQTAAEWRRYDRAN